MRNPSDFGPFKKTTQNLDILVMALRGMTTGIEGVALPGPISGGPAFRRK